MWGFIYVGVFRAAFSGSAVVKMTVDPTGGKYASRWDDSVGTVYTGPTARARPTSLTSTPRRTRAENATAW